MTKTDCAKILAYLTAGTGKSLTNFASEVYFDALSDLSYDVAAKAAKRVLFSHVWATFPSVAEIRQAAVEVMQGKVLSGWEAWGLVQKQVRKFGLDRPTEGFAGLPPMVAKATQLLGWKNICDATNEDAIRAHFVRAYESVVEQTSREMLLAPAMAAKALPSETPKIGTKVNTRNLLNGFGDMPGGK